MPGGIFKPYELDEDDEDLFAEMDDDESEDAVMSMFEGEGEFPEPYSELSADECAGFVAAMECAEEVRRAEPWKKLHDCDVFGVEDPETGGIDIISVLGAGKEVFSLHVHRAPHALSFWRETLSNPGEMDPEWMLHRSSIIEVEFCNKGELGAVYLPSPVMTEVGPVLPVLAIALDATMQIPPQPYVNADLDLVPTQVLWDCLKERCLAGEALPGEIHVSTDAAAATLQAFSQLTGVKVVKVETLSLLSGLFRSMSAGV